MVPVSSVCDCEVGRWLAASLMVAMFVWASSREVTWGTPKQWGRYRNHIVGWSAHANLASLLGTTPNWIGRDRQLVSCHLACEGVCTHHHSFRVLPSSPSP
ncbi:hypothetical protein BCR44DRAFT_1075138 [Catenaria anguillulae PL171]|uniref:Uncharacterized protein n=1 Tax=Catenaria anguillulae PL171 TaxID=765915 RepID=A0A1Y2HQX9_9FUNG|nr:hypothetical protein BCR44DRAFT_1075138 [Catenaria anguillulae PL171]